MFNSALILAINEVLMSMAEIVLLAMSWFYPGLYQEPAEAAALEWVGDVENSASLAEKSLQRSGIVEFQQVGENKINILSVRIVDLPIRAQAAVDSSDHQLPPEVAILPKGERFWKVTASRGNKVIGLTTAFRKKVNALEGQGSVPTAPKDFVVVVPLPDPAVMIEIMRDDEVKVKEYRLNVPTRNFCEQMQAKDKWCVEAGNIF